MQLAQEALSLAPQWLLCSVVVKAETPLGMPSAVCCFP